MVDSPDLELHSAANGPTALALAATLQPDLILLDVMMPGMDGYEVCTRLRADPQVADVPILMVTSLDDRDSRLRGIDAGADDFITKPFDSTELRARMRGILRLNRFRRLHQASERIREQAELIDLAPDAIFVCDLGERITHWNPAAAHLYGWSATEAIGQRADVLLTRGGTSDTSEVEPLAADEWRGEVAQVTRDEKEITVDSRRKLLRDATGKPQAILTINTDLTEKKQTEKRMLRMQRIESIGTLASGVAHDLNNALAPILMGVELLRMSYPNATELIDSMEASARRGAEIVQQLLTFAKGAEGERVHVHSRHLFKEMGNILKCTFPKNVQLRITCAPRLDTILGDATQLHQVLLNLCVNARDAMPNGGTLTLEAENGEIDSAYAGTVPEAKPDKYVIWRVQDSGTGIPPEILERIFEPFFTTKGPDKGTGLGLSTVVGIVKGHQGFVRVHSTPGCGTTFTIYLPAEGANKGQTDMVIKAEVTFRGNGETMLVVDDETAVRDVSRRVLTALNFRVLTASDGAEALIQAAEHRAELRAVITDLHMPNMDGLILVRMLKRMLPQADIIVASGRMDQREEDELKTMGVAFLDKPFTQERLVAALKAIFVK